MGLREPLHDQLSRRARPLPAPQPLLIPLTLFFSNLSNTIWRYIVYLMARLEAWEPLSCSDSAWHGVALDKKSVVGMNEWTTKESQGSESLKSRKYYFIFKRRRGKIFFSPFSWDGVVFLWDFCFSPYFSLFCSFYRLPKSLKNSIVILLLMNNSFFPWYSYSRAHCSDKRKYFYQ